MTFFFTIFASLISLGRTCSQTLFFATGAKLFFIFIFLLFLQNGRRRCQLYKMYSCFYKMKIAMFLQPHGVESSLFNLSIL
jgi:hypothetical protein